MSVVSAFSGAHHFSNRSELKQNVSIISVKQPAKQARPKGTKRRISVCAVTLLLLTVTCLAPSSQILGACDSIHMPASNGLPNVALQNRLVGSIALIKALRTTGSFFHIVNSATISANDLPLARSLPRMIELSQESLSTSKSVDSAIKVRAPPFHILSDINQS